MCACNCFDQISNGKIQEINSDMYDCFSDTEDHSAKYDLGQNYICTECSPQYLKTIKIEKTGLNRQSKTENTQAKGAQSSAETPHITFPFSEFFSGSACNSSKSIFLDYEVISNMFLLLSKTQFSPWKVYLQYGKTGVMLHFYLESSSESLPTKKLTMFCPFLFGAPYQVSFSVYALGKQVDSGFLPNDYLNRVSDLLDTLFSLQLCLGIYDEKLLKAIKMRKPIDDSGSDCDKTYQIDTKFVLSNRFGKQISETIRSINPQRPCKRLLDLSHSHAQRCQNCTVLLQNTNLFHEQHMPSDKCSTDSHTALSKLSFAELLERYKNLKKSCDYWKSRTKYYMKSKKIKPPVNFNICSTELGRLIDKAVEDNLLTQNSVLYLLLLDTVIGLQKQEKEFIKSNKMTTNRKRPRAKGMRYHPLVIKWCCSLASKCREKGYESIRNILPLPHWQTIKQYRQTSSSSEPINQENLRRMVQEMERQNCKAIGGIHWDEMMIQEGIVVCKRTGELVGFENLDIPRAISDDFDSMQKESSESSTSDKESSDSESDQNSSSSSSNESDSGEYPTTNTQLKAKMVCQFFFSSVEGDFSWPVASFPVRQMNSAKLKVLVWKVIEVLSKTTIKNKPIQVLYGVCDGSSYSHAFFCKSNIQNWVSFNPYNNNVPIWWLSDYPHLIKKLRNFIVNPDRNMEWSKQSITSQHLIDVVERKQTKLRWKHVKLSARTKMSVKRAVEVCSEEVVTDICQGSYPLEETIGTRMYLSICAKLFRIMNDSTGIDPSSYRELVKIMNWFTKWNNEIQMTMPEKGLRKAHLKKFITERTYKDLLRSIRAFLGLVQYIQMNYPDTIIIPKTMCQDDVENYFSL